MRADRAVELAIASQRATLALVGSHRRRTYAHDLVYGQHLLYRLVGKPWNAATEGGEHAHQDFKAYFKNMVHHTVRGQSDCYQMMRQRLVGKSTKQRLGPSLLPCSNYAAMRCGAVIGKEENRTKRALKRNPVKGSKAHVLVSSVRETQKHKDNVNRLKAWAADKSL